MIWVILIVAATYFGNKIIVGYKWVPMTYEEREMTELGLDFNDPADVREYYDYKRNYYR